jgi:hypothetical protein
VRVLLDALTLAVVVLEHKGLAALVVLVREVVEVLLRHFQELQQQVLALLQALMVLEAAAVVLLLMHLMLEHLFQVQEETALLVSFTFTTNVGCN